MKQEAGMDEKMKTGYQKAKVIPGYTYGQNQPEHSPVSPQNFDLLMQTVTLTEDDLRALRQSHDILKDQVEDILDVWYGFVGKNPHLLHYFANRRTNQPDAHYLDAVRKRFGQWILDTARAEYDQKWLDYQHEIGLRHTVKKNKTDNVDSVPIIHFRDLIGLYHPLTATLKPFLARQGANPEDVEKMHAAWQKSILLQLILWSYPYVKEGLY